MNCPHVSAFFSCSFRKDDKDVNDYFKSLCEALNISCKNVSDGYSSTPPEVARKLIEDSKVVLAVIPKRDQTTSGTWTMPSAAHEEIAMAFALKKPTLIVVEDGVACDGFLSNFGTYIGFERSQLYTNSFIGKVVSSLHELRLEAVEQHNMLPDQDAAGFYADKVLMLIDINRDSGTPAWNYTMTRKLVFTRPFEGPLISKVWADYVPESATKKIVHDIQFSSNRTDIKPIQQIIKDTPQQLEVTVDFDPKPQKDDWIEMEFTYSSPHLNPLSRAEIAEDKITSINGQTFDCFDGVIPIQPTRDLRVQVRFPPWYPVDRNTIFPFVGSYSNGVDYIVESEIRRCEISVSKFGASTQIDIHVESPLMRHVYGVAWNLS